MSNSFRVTPKTKEEVVQLLKKYNIENYSINEDLSVDVRGIVDLSRENLEHIPINFNKVLHSFHCNFNNLKSLAGAPKEVGADFSCMRNKLTSLKHMPLKATSVDCSFNFLKSLDCLPLNVETLRCDNNQITSLRGVFDTIHTLTCTDNLLTSLKYCPADILNLDCSSNKLTILDLPFSIKRFFTLDISNNLIKTLQNFHGNIEDTIRFHDNQLSVDELIYLYQDKFKTVNITNDHGEKINKIQMIQFLLKQKAVLDHL